jgi:FixJ family two-component response regulator
MRKESKRQTPEPVVYIVDDDVSMRESLEDLFRSMRIEALAFESPSEFLGNADLDRPGCIVLDVRLPGVNGLDFQSQLESSGSKMPIVFMTGFGDIPMSVRAMKAGAMDFLAKPFRDQDILDAVAAAIQRDLVRRQETEQKQVIASRVNTLTPRECEVMAAVVKGMMNKQIAYQLGITEITVKLHRGNVMRKMQVRSVADLVRVTERIAEEYKNVPDLA